MLLPYLLISVSLIQCGKKLFTGLTCYIVIVVRRQLNFIGLLKFCVIKICVLICHKLYTKFNYLLTSIRFISVFSFCFCSFELTLIGCFCIPSTYFSVLQDIFPVLKNLSKLSILDNELSKSAVQSIPLTFTT